MKITQLRHHFSTICLLLPDRHVLTKTTVPLKLTSAMLAFVLPENQASIILPIDQTVDLR